jgi:predicted DNA-binding helix-hairpin-helix protein
MNLEIPTESGLKLLAPDKNHQDMIKPMRFVKNELIQYKEERKNLKAHLVCSSRSNTQVIVGATQKMIFKSFSCGSFYNNFNLKRFIILDVPVSNDVDCRQ